SSALGFDIRGMALGDLDGDTKVDLVANYAAGNWSLGFHKGNGNGTFQTGVGIPNSAFAIPNLFISDADGDGDLDIYSGSLQGNFKVFANNGSASFTKMDVGAGAGTLLVTHDLNGDSKADVITGTGDVVTVTLTNGSGGFLTPTTAGAISLNPRHGAVGDFNDDGIADVAIVAVDIFSGVLHDGELWILRGNGDGTFADPYRVATYRNNFTIAAGNFDMPADTTPPDIAPSVDGTLGGDGWYTDDVTVSWSVTDAESEVSASGCETQSVTSDTDGVPFTCEATSLGGTTSRSVTIKRDTTGPAITSATANPGMLWPPNNKMVAVTVSVNASDAGAGLASCIIDSVDSNEGGSAHEPDVELTGPLTLNLRAERTGGGNGRIYTARISCADRAGNRSTTTATVAVPHDQGKKK
ncbi:MAG: VCBS repeat-containing protein, partial [Acidobacteriota bacterium]|nr:VCBS repeat-containing protein [Acidobacteriota bacterium]